MASAIEKYLDGLKSDELLLKFTWDEWLAIAPPYSDRKFTSTDVTARYQRNGYDWDMHGTLYTPEQETDPRRAFVFFHGGAGSEKIMDLTPDGRPGLARVVAAQGFQSPRAHLSRPLPARRRVESSHPRAHADLSHGSRAESGRNC